MKQMHGHSKFQGRGLAVGFQTERKGKEKMKVVRRD